MNVENLPKRLTRYATNNLTPNKIALDINIYLKRKLNLIGYRKARKVFAVGFNKTGTTSLHYLFEKMRLPSYHGVLWRPCDNMKLFKEYDCFSDGAPQKLSFLDDTFPNSKFILQVRDLAPWIYSRLAHIIRDKRPNRPPIWQRTEFAVKSWILNRNKHHHNVLSYFKNRPEDFLLVNVTRDPQASKKICKFLGYDKSLDMPKKNVHKAKKQPEKHANILKNVIEELKIKEEELFYDVLCPSAEKNKKYNSFPLDTEQFPLKS